MNILHLEVMVHPPPLAIVNVSMDRSFLSYDFSSLTDLCAWWTGGMGLQKKHSDVEVKTSDLALTPLPLAATFDRSLSLIK